MDVVTHMLMGLVIASPFAEGRPMAAVAFTFGMVAPDLDALSRTFGRRAFLAAHQTWTHAIPVLLLLGLGAGLLLHRASLPLLPAAALTCGMVLHALLDATNTYGVALLWPLRRGRHAAEWVFFIDAAVVAATVLCFAIVAARVVADTPPGWVPIGYAVFLACYVALKAWLRRRAGRLAPAGTVSLVPSALVPWHFLGTIREGDEARLFRLDVWSGEVDREERLPLYDRDFEEQLAAVSEFRLMQRLSTAYHVVGVERSAEETVLSCRDLRTRNFATSFGALDVHLGPDGEVGRVRFHV